MSGISLNSVGRSSLRLTLSEVSKSEFGSGKSSATGASVCAPRPRSKSEASGGVPSVERSKLPASNEPKSVEDSPSVLKSKLSVERSCTP